jgi:cation diffusion facilitator CzcD-associated flavoprotein CzcO
MTTTRPKAAVVGAGFGGIALAIRLQAGGYDVTLLEKRDKPGGRAYVYEDEASSSTPARRSSRTRPPWKSSSRSPAASSPITSSSCP